MAWDKRTVADSPISRNLLRILKSGEGYSRNIKKCENVGISQANLQGWINGHRTPQVASLKKFAELFNVDVYSLFADSDENLPPNKKELIDLIKKNNNPEILNAAKMLLRIGIIPPFLSDENKEKGG